MNGYLGFKPLCSLCFPRITTIQLIRKFLRVSTFYYSFTNMSMNFLSVYSFHLLQNGSFCFMMRASNNAIISQWINGQPANCFISITFQSFNLKNNLVWLLFLSFNNLPLYSFSSTFAKASVDKVENIGVEPMTSSMPWKRSSQLS